MPVGSGQDRDGDRESSVTGFTDILTFEVFQTESLTLERPKDVRLPLFYFYFYLSK